MTNQKAAEILGRYDVSDLHFYTTDGEEIPFAEWSDAIETAISALRAQDLQPICNELATDTISRQAAIDAVNSETVSTNPEHFKSSEKFIKFMDDADIASFGKWQWANGFNTAVVAAKIQLEKLPSAQPKPYLDSIVSEIKKTISETKENGKYHCADIRINGEMICFGLQLALEIIEEKRNEQSDKQTDGD